MVINVFHVNKYFVLYNEIIARHDIEEDDDNDEYHDSDGTSTDDEEKEDKAVEEEEDGDFVDPKQSKEDITDDEILNANFPTSGPRYTQKKAAKSHSKGPQHSKLLQSQKKNIKGSTTAKSVASAVSSKHTLGNTKKR